MRITSLILIPGLTMTVQAEPPRVEHHQEPLAMGAKLWIRQGDGHVGIEGWDKPEVALEARFQDDSRGGKAELRLNRVSEGLEIEVNEPSRHGVFFGRYRSALCHLTLKVPRKLNVAVRTVDGDIWVKDLDGYARCESADGNIQIEALRGEALTQTVDGRIEVRDLNARIKGHTVDGDIKLERVTGGIDLKTSDGDIEARELDGWGEGIFLTTTDGSIHVKLGGAKGNLDARTSDGELDVVAPDLQIQEMSTHRLRARIPGRDQSIRLQTGDGDIHVE